MTIKKRFITVGLFIIAVVVIYSLIGMQDGDNKMLQVESVPLSYPSGWGYNILVDHKIFIHQENMPAITGNKGFASKEDAMKTADLVIKKLINKQQPVVTKNDLMALKISF